MADVAQGSQLTADTLMLARLLSTAALIAGTTEYAEIIKRRIARRAEAREHRVLEERGLHGLVRIFLADTEPAEASLAGNQ